MGRQVAVIIKFRPRWICRKWNLLGRNAITARGLLALKVFAEASNAPTPPAIANATIYDAVGVRINDFPITPEKILATLGQKNEPQF